MKPAQHQKKLSESREKAIDSLNILSQHSNRAKELMKNKMKELKELKAQNQGKDQAAQIKKAEQFIKRAENLINKIAQKKEDLLKFQIRKEVSLEKQFGRSNKKPIEQKRERMHSNFAKKKGKTHSNVKQVEQLQKRVEKQRDFIKNLKDFVKGTSKKSSMRPKSR